MTHSNSSLSDSTTQAPTAFSLANQLDALAADIAAAEPTGTDATPWESRLTDLRLRLQKIERSDTSAARDARLNDLSADINELAREVSTQGHNPSPSMQAADHVIDSIAKIVS